MPIDTASPSPTGLVQGPGRTSVPIVPQPVPTAKSYSQPDPQPSIKQDQKPPVQNQSSTIKTLHTIILPPLAQCHHLIRPHPRVHLHQDHRPLVHPPLTLHHPPVTNRPPLPHCHGPLYHGHSPPLPPYAAPQACPRTRQHTSVFFLTSRRKRKWREKSGKRNKSIYCSFIFVPLHQLAKIEPFSLWKKNWSDIFVTQIFLISITGPLSQTRLLMFWRRRKHVTKYISLPCCWFYSGSISALGFDSELEIGSTQRIFTASVFF